MAAFSSRVLNTVGVLLSSAVQQNSLESRQLLQLWQAKRAVSLLFCAVIGSCSFNAHCYCSL